MHLHKTFLVEYSRIDGIPMLCELCTNWSIIDPHLLLTVQEQAYEYGAEKQTSSLHHSSNSLAGQIMFDRNRENYKRNTGT
jgi:hypothetical protein